MVIWCFMIKCSTSTRVHKQSSFSETISFSADDCMAFLQIPQGLHMILILGLAINCAWHLFYHWHGQSHRLLWLYPGLPAELFLTESQPNILCHCVYGLEPVFTGWSSILKCGVCYIQNPQRANQALGFLLCGGKCRMQQFVFYLGWDITQAPDAESLIELVGSRISYPLEYTCFTKVSSILEHVMAEGRKFKEALRQSVSEGFYSIHVNRNNFWSSFLVIIGERSASAKPVADTIQTEAFLIWSSNDPRPRIATVIRIAAWLSLW